MKLASALYPAIVQVLFAGTRTGEPIRPIDPRYQAKELVAAGAFSEGPGSVKCGGELVNHGAKQIAWTEDNLWPANQSGQRSAFSNPLVRGTNPRRLLLLAGGACFQHEDPVAVAIAITAGRRELLLPGVLEW